jgi:hypothetical protein
VCRFFVLRDSRKEKNDLPIRSRADQVEAVTKNKYRRMMRCQCPRTDSINLSLGRVDSLGLIGEEKHRHESNSHGITLVVQNKCVARSTEPINLVSSRI